LDEAMNGLLETNDPGRASSHGRIGLSSTDGATDPVSAATALGATGTPAVSSAGNPPRTTDTRWKPARINCSATRALVASSGQSQ
jgi:hypothetical protein